VVIDWSWGELKVGDCSGVPHVISISPSSNVVSAIFLIQQPLPGPFLVFWDIPPETGYAVLHHSDTYRGVALMTSTSDDGNPNTQGELPKDEKKPDSRDMDLSLELPDEPLTVGRLPCEVMIITTDEQRQVFEEAGVPLDGVDSTHHRKKKKR
jgi:hypothetical protein